MSQRKDHGARRASQYPASPFVATTIAICFGAGLWVLGGPVIEPALSMIAGRESSYDSWVPRNQESFLACATIVVAIAAFAGSRRWRPDIRDYRISQNTLLVMLTFELAVVVSGVDVVYANIRSDEMSVLAVGGVGGITFAVTYFSASQTVLFNDMLEVHLWKSASALRREAAALESAPLGQHLMLTAGGAERGGPPERWKLFVRQSVVPLAILSSVALLVWPTIGWSVALDWPFQAAAAAIMSVYLFFMGFLLPWAVASSPGSNSRIARISASMAVAAPPVVWMVVGALEAVMLFGEYDRDAFWIIVMLVVGVLATGVFGVVSVAGVFGKVSSLKMLFLYRRAVRSYVSRADRVRSRMNDLRVEMEARRR